MPLTSPASYLPTVNAFVSHWIHVDLALPAPLTLRGGVGLGTLEALREQLHTQRTAVIAAENQVQFARGQIKTQSRALRRRLVQFNARVRVAFGEGAFVDALPAVPNVRAGQDRMLTPLADAANIWAQIESTGQSLVLSGDFTLTGFQNALASLRQSYDAHTLALSNRKLTIGARNTTQARLYQLLKQYRLAVPTHFPKTSEYVTSLPRLVRVQHKKEKVGAAA